MVQISLITDQSQWKTTKENLLTCTAPEDGKFDTKVIMQKSRPWKRKAPFCI
jgi:hypothetical protein